MNKKIGAPGRLGIVKKAEPQARRILPPPLRPAVMEVDVIPPQGGPGPASSCSWGLVAEAVRHAHGVVPMETEEQDFNLGAPFTFLQHNQAMRLDGDVHNVTNNMAALNVGVDPALAMGVKTYLQK